MLAERARCGRKSRADEYNNLFGDEEDDDDDDLCCRANAELVLSSSAPPHSSTIGNPVDRLSDRVHGAWYIYYVCIMFMYMRIQKSN